MTKSSVSFPENSGVLLTVDGRRRLTGGALRPGTHRRGKVPGSVVAMENPVLDYGDMKEARQPV